jgi:hypothetical protein
MRSSFTFSDRGQAKFHFGSSRVCSPLSLLLCQPKCKAAHLVIVNELDPVLIERCLDQHH